MIKRTLYFGNPAYLNLSNKQLVINLPEADEYGKPTDTIKKAATIPVEDIGVIILDDKQITITHGLLAALLDNNAAILTCDDKHLPNGYLMPLCEHTIQTEKFKAQIEANQPLKKNLWQQTVQAKITNQAKVLAGKKIDHENMLHWAGRVRSGDPDNYEARAAAYYWKNIFREFEIDSNELLSIDFRRERFGDPPNNLLNYGYAILRAIIARSLVGSGLLPTLGIHHHNRYNAYCLADDIMEPYRPFVDRKVHDMLCYDRNISELQKEHKKQLLEIATTDVIINDERSPLMVAAQRTSASVAKCFEGEIRKIAYPEFP